jgi:UDP-N-acetylmuramoyl-L-alanyl-D-glutamate--2,6-diaminopimelate ligase
MYEGATYPYTLPLVGEFNISNALAAIGLAVGEGHPIRDVLDAIAGVPAIPGRMTSIQVGQPFGVLVDYAHTPESLAKVLILLRRLRPAGRLITVFGSAGERDAVKRPIQGKVAHELADYAVFTNEDPRYENPQSIVEEIAEGARRAGGTRGVSFACIVDRREAIRHALDVANPGDTVLLAGKGHEQSIIINGVKEPWDEVTVALEELAAIGWTE